MSKSSVHVEGVHCREVEITPQAALTFGNPKRSDCHVRLTEFMKRFTYHAKIVLLTLGILTFEISLASVLGATTSQNVDKILVFGDSLSAAYGMDKSEGWVALLQSWLNQQKPHNKKFYQVINASISGETTHGGLRRIDQALATHNPKIVILELGANDGLRGFPLKTIRQNLNELVKKIRDSGASVLIAGIHVPPNFGPVYANRFFELFEETATQHQVAYLPFLLENVALVPGLLQKDGLHPTAEAQPIILNTILPILRPMLTN